MWECEINNIVHKIRKMLDHRDGKVCGYGYKQITIDECRRVKQNSILF